MYRFPPVVSRALIEKSGYLKSFQHLLRCVCALDGDEARVEAAVAACYPIYPIAAARGRSRREG